MTNIITQFYQAFQKKEIDGMIACYHPDLIFEDPAFGKLNYTECCAMWSMLLESQKDKDFEVTFSDIQLIDNSGSANWEAKYNFSKTGRWVHNKISAQMKIKEGKIVTHSDHFNLYQWAKMALGFQGTLIGWTSFFKNKLNGQTKGMLKRYMEKNNL